MDENADFWTTRFCILKKEKKRKTVVALWAFLLPLHHELTVHVSRVPVTPRELPLRSIRFHLVAGKCYQPEVHRQPNFQLNMNFFQHPRISTLPPLTQTNLEHVCNEIHSKINIFYLQCVQSMKIFI